MQDVDYLVFKAIAKILIRKGIITAEEMEVEVDNLQRVSPDAAHNLEMLWMSAHSMTASEFEADYRRRQMRERTALLEGKAKPDGGKADI